MPYFNEYNEPNTIQAHGIVVLEKKHQAIKALKRKHKPSVHGHKLWHSSFLLMDYLNFHPLPNKSSLMEIGCGWGTTSIFCAKRFGAKATGVDLDPNVFPYLHTLAEFNQVTINTEQAPLEKLSKAKLANHHTVLGTDICFWDELVNKIYNLIRRSLQAGVTQVVLADPGRSTFHQLVARCSKKYSTECHPWYTQDPEFISGYVLCVSAR
ncbi:class I SAM-dependent methyltransferase [Zooshikella ganghwensis]|uniref:class I SAM-dependent methyltransferase n=1 Tax=Zooshikella ganghwensis TaxID=202772 RepID=UPI000419965D|nr:methyltransferase domain-containing protein [Zooshikella ganghwensis]